MDCMAPPAKHQAYGVWIPNIYMQVFLDSRNTKRLLLKAHSVVLHKGTQAIEEVVYRHG